MIGGLGQGRFRREFRPELSKSWILGKSESWRYLGPENNEELMASRANERLGQYETVIDRYEMFSEPPGFVLMVDFPFYSDELEGFQFPLCVNLMMKCPVGVVSFGRGKFRRGIPPPKYFMIRDGSVSACRLEDFPVPEVAIARGAGFLKSQTSQALSSLIYETQFRVNVKTMSLARNEYLANFVFEEKDFCPIPDPFLPETIGLLTGPVAKFGGLMPVHGRIHEIKNQLTLVENIDPEITQEHPLVFLGPLGHDARYLSRLFQTVRSRRIRAYFLGHVSKTVSAQLTASASLTLIPMDMRVSQQPHGYPRVMGESVSFGTPVVANLPVTVPDFLGSSVRRVDFTDSELLNQAISETLKLKKPPTPGMLYFEIVSDVLWKIQVEREIHAGQSG